MTIGSKFIHNSSILIISRVTPNSNIPIISRVTLNNNIPIVSKAILNSNTPIISRATLNSNTEVNVKAITDHKIIADSSPLRLKSRKNLVQLPKKSIKKRSTKASSENLFAGFCSHF